MANFAIAFDLDTETLKQTYPNESFNNAYADIRKVLESCGFTRQQGSVYFGDNNVDAVKAVMATQKIAKRFDWFRPSVKDIRLLRIEDDNDLMIAINDD